MARKKGKHSKGSFDSLGLEPSEDLVLLKLLDKTDQSVSRLKRTLIREWIEKNKKLLEAKA